MGGVGGWVGWVGRETYLPAPRSESRFLMKYRSLGSGAMAWWYVCVWPVGWDSIQLGVGGLLRGLEWRKGGTAAKHPATTSSRRRQAEKQRCVCVWCVCMCLSGDGCASRADVNGSEALPNATPSQRRSTHHTFSSLMCERCFPFFSPSENGVRRTSSVRLFFLSWTAPGDMHGCLPFGARKEALSALSSSYVPTSFGPALVVCWPLDRAFAIAPRNPTIIFFRPRGIRPQKRFMWKRGGPCLGDGKDRHLDIFDGNDRHFDHFLPRPTPRPSPVFFSSWSFHFAASGMASAAPPSGRGIDSAEQPPLPPPPLPPPPTNDPKPRLAQAMQCNTPPAHHPSSEAVPHPLHRHGAAWVDLFHPPTHPPTPSVVQGFPWFPSIHRFQAFPTTSVLRPTPSSTHPLSLLLSSKPAHPFSLTHHKGFPNQGDECQRQGWGVKRRVGRDIKKKEIHVEVMQNDKGKWREGGGRGRGVHLL